MSAVTPSRIVLVALFALSPAIAVAEDVNWSGDGSDANNPDLLRPGFSDCTNCEVAHAPSDWNEPFFDIDWSVGLRGAYQTGTTGSKTIGSVLPVVTLTHTGLRSSLSIAAAGEFVQTSVDPFRTANASLIVKGAYKLDEFTRAEGTGTLALTQDAPNPPGIEIAPQVVSGSGEAAITRDMGRFSASLRGSLSRTIYGPTTGPGGVLIDNSWQNNTAPGAGLRLAVPVTPTLAAFVDGSAVYRLFDGPSPYVGASLNGPTYAGKVGFSYDYHGLLTGEASVGYALRRFDAGLPDVAAMLYDARIAYTPDETTSISASFGTTVDTPGTTAGALARVTYTASADLRYKVNPWVAVRGTAGWYHTDAVGTGGVETGYSAGAGLDYLLNEMTTVSLDYGYAHVDSPPSAPTDTHKVTLGMTFAR